MNPSMVSSYVEISYISFSGSVAPSSSVKPRPENPGRPSEKAPKAGIDSVPTPQSDHNMV